MADSPQFALFDRVRERSEVAAGIDDPGTVVGIRRSAVGWWVYDVSWDKFRINGNPVLARFESDLVPMKDWTP